MKRFFFRQLSFALVIAMLLSLAGVAEESRDDLLGSTEFDIAEENEILTQNVDAILEETEEAVFLGQILLAEEQEVAAPEATVADGVEETGAAQSNGIPEKLSLGVKEEFTLKVSGATFKSSKKSVAAVSKKGVITAKKKGSATITATEGEKTIGACEVTVLAAPKKVALSKTKVKITAGETYTLTAKLPKKTASNKLTWKSSNKKVAKVDANGVVTGIKAGTAKITVTTFNKKKATCKVTVKKEPEPTAVPTATPAQEESYTDMRLRINDVEVSVDWEKNDSVAALRDLVKAQPLTIQMSPYGGFEQVGSLGTSLPRNDVQTTTQPGDIVLYSGSNIVIFYGSNSWAYTRLGHIEGMSSDELNKLLSGSGVKINITYEAR